MKIIWKSDSSVAIYVEIKQNNIDIFGTRNVKKTKTDKTKSKASSKIVTNLFIATQQRDADLDKLFQYEISHPPPPFLSGAEINMGKTNSTLMSCLVNEDVDLPVRVDCTAVLVDGSFIAHFRRPKCVQTIGAYIEQMRQLAVYSRIDLMFDRYFDLSIKDVTRVGRGTGGRYHIMPNTPIPRKWKQFLRNSENKTEMFKLIAEYVSTLQIPDGKQVVCTSEEKALSFPRTPVDDISPCAHEEVDTRILLQAKHAVHNGHTTILIKASDIDIVVISLSLFDEIGTEKLFIEYGTAKNLRFLPIHEIRRSLAQVGSFILLRFNGCRLNFLICWIW